MADVSQLLQKVIGLIEQDVTAIANMSKFGDKLPHTVAADLVDYSRALLNLSSNLEAKSKDEARRLSKMTTEELLELAKPLVEGKSQ
jgi:hypothetical protein